MTVLGFSLHPFSPSGFFRIAGDVARRSGALVLRYELTGPLDELAIPETAAPARRGGLWEETCFEFFLAVKNSPEYREFNLSPSGEWNIYRFADYREGMEEEEAFASLPFHVERDPDVLRLSLEIDLSRIVPPGGVLEAGVSAVIKKKNGELTFWALAHPGPEPDFHRRESFILEL